MIVGGEVTLAVRTGSMTQYALSEADVFKYVQIFSQAGPSYT